METNILDFNFTFSYIISAVKEEKQKLKDADAAREAFAEMDVNKDGM